jgi:hypothetical protein
MVQDCSWLQVTTVAGYTALCLPQLLLLLLLLPLKTPLTAAIFAIQTAAGCTDQMCENAIITMS